MENIQNRRLYTNMLFGFIGLFLTVVGVGILIFIPELENPLTLVMIFFGLSLTINYIYYLERKTGVPNRVIWVRAIILIITLLALRFILF